MELFEKFYIRDFSFVSNHKKIFKFVAILLSTLTLFNTISPLTSASGYWKEKDIRKRSRKPDSSIADKEDISNLSYEHEHFLEEEISKIISKKEISSIEQSTLKSIKEKMKSYNAKEFSLDHCYCLLQIEIHTICILNSPKETINAIIRYNYNLCNSGIPTESKKFLEEMFYIFLVIENSNLSEQSMGNVSIGLYCKLFELFPCCNKNLLFPSIKECLNKLIEEESKY